jgi:hypothetical protein
MNGALWWPKLEGVSPMNKPHSIGIAAVLSLVLMFTSAAGWAQLPDWTSIPINPGATGAVEATLVYSIDGLTVSFYSALTRSWTSITTVNTPVAKIYNDHVMIRDGTTFYAYSPRFPTPVPLVTSAGVLVNSSAQTWYSVVIDGTTTHVFLAYYGSWFTIPTAAPVVTQLGRWAGLVGDGTTVWGISAYYPNAVQLGTAGATPASAYGYQAFATSPGLVHAFSASRATWSSIPVSGGATVLSGATQSGVAYVKDLPYVHFFSGFRGAFTTTLASPGALIQVASRTIGLVVDGNTVKAYSALKGTISTVVYPSPPNTVLKDYCALLYSGTTALAFSGPHGAFSAPITGVLPGAAHMNQIAALDPSTGNLVAVYSGFLNQWVAAPTLTGPQANLWVNSLSVIVLDGAGFHALSPHSTTWTFEPSPPPEVTWDGAGDWIARIGTTLKTFNSNTNAFRTQITNAPATLANLHDNAHVVIDGDGSAAYGFSNFLDRWATVQLAGPVVQYGADKQAAFVNDGISIHGYGGIGQTSNVNEYPDWVRVLPTGSQFLAHLSGEIGANALMVASAVPANILTPYGTLYLDPSSLIVLFSGPIPPSGVQTIAVPIPDLPELAGLTVYLQSGIFAGPNGFYLTEFATTTIL